jgi:hypothetical protein
MYWSYIHSLLQTVPLLPQYAENGDIYNFQDPDGNMTYGKGWNPIMFNNPWENLSKGGFNSMAESRNFNASATAFLTIQPIKGLRFRSQFNYNWGAGAYRSYGEPRAPSDGAAIVNSYSASQSTWLNTSFSIENTLTYDLPLIAGHKISAMVGQSFQSSAWSTNLGASNKVVYGEQLATLKGWDSSWMSNFKLGSTIVDALCILKLNCQPPSIYSSIVLSLLGLKSKLTIRVGKRTWGIVDFGLFLLPLLFKVPCKLKVFICVIRWLSTLTTL